MTCDDVRARLTAYLDGELDGDRGTVVRGHLRGCAACRQIASDEAALRDGLRALPTLDPPPSLWAGVQARLAAEEIEAARAPAWRRLFARWARHLETQAPRLAIGAALAAVAVAALWWRAQRDDDDAAAPRAGEVVAVPSPRIEAGTDPRPPAATGPTGSITRVTPAAPPAPAAPSGDDVTAELAAEPARLTASYADAAEELVALAGDACARWTDDERAAFDARLAELRAEIADAAEGRPRQRAWRALIRYLQGAIVRDDVALASGGAP